MKKNNFLITEHSNYSKNAIEKLKHFGNVYTQNDDFKKSDINVLIIRLKYFIDKKFVDNYPNLQFILSPTTGLNHIDLVYLNKIKVNVISLKGEASFLNTIHATPDFTLSLILNQIRKITISNNEFSFNKYTREKYISKEFSDTQIGIAGFGRVGKILHQKLNLLNFNCLVYDPFINNKIYHQINFQDDIKAFISNIDVLVICISYNSENFNFFNKEKLSYLKKGSIIINTSRGEVLDESYLIDLLKIGHLSSAALDVLSIENKKNDKLLNKIKNYFIDNNNLTITPHIAGATFGSMRRTEDFIINKFIKSIKNSK